MIQPHGYYLWANSNNNYALTIHADASTSATLAGDNSIAVRNGPINTGSVIDQVQWGTSTGTPLGEGTPFVTNPTAGQSIERKAYTTSSSLSMKPGGADEFSGNGFDTNNNTFDFTIRMASQPQNSSSSTETP